MRQYTQYIIITLIFSVLTVKPITAHNQLSDTITVEAFDCGDSIKFQITVYKIEIQMTFLMQGLNIQIIQPDTTTISFPSALLVKDKVKRHPNEVKATLLSQTSTRSFERDSANQVRRPDVRPLIAALNDTDAIISHNHIIMQTTNFNIGIHLEKTVMTFSVSLPSNFIDITNDTISVCISSTPAFKGVKEEYTGNRLSKKHIPTPKGLGEGIKKEDFPSRIIKRHITSKIIKK